MLPESRIVAGFPSWAKSLARCKAKFHNVCQHPPCPGQNWSYGTRVKTRKIHQHFECLDIVVHLSTEWGLTDPDAALKVPGS
ncbi:hypothetical protein SUGI_0211790 [Cryptomeria japonica]|nr:hypothetical protein SUGI_0211790 [Cryptomeria japonica]